jgi:predicted nuclease of predicted toxin-antitoxin system
VRFLVDASLSPRLASRLNELGHDARACLDLDLLASPDEEVLEVARLQHRVVLSADSDFGTILARTHATSPSVVFVRRTQGRRVEELVALIQDNLSVLEAPLEHHSIVVIGEGAVRIRNLPLL